MKCGDVVVVAEKSHSCLDILHTHVEGSYYDTTHFNLFSFKSRQNYMS